MLGRMFSTRALALGGVVLLAGVAGANTQITIWGGGAAPAPAAADATGGATYGGGYATTTGAYVVQSREVDVPAAGGEIRFAGVPQTVDAASVHLTADGVRVLAQRFQPGARTATEALARGVGGAVTVVTQKGEVAGVLRAVDDTSIVVETSGGALSVMRRDGYVLDIRLANAPKDLDKPALIWRVAATKPGKRAATASYRAEGLTWAADYLAVLDESGRAIDFSAWASIKNATTATFDDADVTLVTNATTLARRPAPGSDPPAALAERNPTAGTKPAQQRFAVPGQVTIGAGDSVQVELMPAKTDAKARTVVTYEALADTSDQYLDFPNTDCSQSSGAGGAGAAEVGVEIDLPPGVTLPPGRVRLFQKRDKAVDIVSDDPLVVTAGGALRMRLEPDAEIDGERKALQCDYDEQGRTLKEKIEVTVKSKAKAPLDVVVREYMWRTPLYKLDAPGWKKPASGQAEEKLVHLAAGGKATWNYTVVYTWQ
jgi:hypothetical protein